MENNFFICLALFWDLFDNVKDQITKNFIERIVISIDWNTGQYFVSNFTVNLQIFSLHIFLNFCFCNDFCQNVSQRVINFISNPIIKLINLFSFNQRFSAFIDPWANFFQIDCNNKATDYHGDNNIRNFVRSFLNTLEEMSNTFNGDFSCESSLSHNEKIHDHKMSESWTSFFFSESFDESLVNFSAGDEIFSEHKENALSAEIKNIIWTSSQIINEFLSERIFNWQHKNDLAWNIKWHLFLFNLLALP